MSLGPGRRAGDFLLGRCVVCDEQLALPDRDQAGMLLRHLRTHWHVSSCLGRPFTPPQDAHGSSGWPTESVDGDLLEYLRVHYRDRTLTKEARKNVLNTWVLVHDRLARNVDWDSLLA